MLKMSYYLTKGHAYIPYIHAPSAHTRWFILDCFLTLLVDSAWWRKVESNSLLLWKLSLFLMACTSSNAYKLWSIQPSFSKHCQRKVREMESDWTRKNTSWQYTHSYMCVGIHSRAGWLPSLLTAVFLVILIWIKTPQHCHTFGGFISDWRVEFTVGLPDPYWFYRKNISHWDMWIGILCTLKGLTRNTAVSMLALCCSMVGNFRITPCVAKMVMTSTIFNHS